jgi:cold shock CspA family protein
MPTSLQGIVREFDDPAGMGWIAGHDGTDRFFHCTQIADGTRTIAVGAPVAYELLPYLGRYEATAITKLALSVAV